MVKTIQKHQKYLTYAEASDYLGLPVGTLYAWVSEKRIPHIRLGARTVRFDPAELVRWLDERRVSGEH